MRQMFQNFGRELRLWNGFALRNGGGRYHLRSLAATTALLCILMFFTGVPHKDDGLSGGLLLLAANLAAGVAVSVVLTMLKISVQEKSGLTMNLAMSDREQVNRSFRLGLLLVSLAAAGIWLLFTVGQGILYREEGNVRVWAHLWTRMLALYGVFVPVVYAKDFRIQMLWQGLGSFLCILFSAILSSGSAFVEISLISWLLTALAVLILSYGMCCFYHCRHGKRSRGVRGAEPARRQSFPRAEEPGKERAGMKKKKLLQLYIWNGLKGVKYWQGLVLMIVLCPFLFRVFLQSQSLLLIQAEEFICSVGCGLAVVLLALRRTYQDRDSEVSRMQGNGAQKIREGYLAGLEILLFLLLIPVSWRVLDIMGLVGSFEKAIRRGEYVRDFSYGAAVLSFIVLLYDLCFLTAVVRSRGKLLGIGALGIGTAAVVGMILYRGLYMAGVGRETPYSPYRMYLVAARLPGGWLTAGILLTAAILVTGFVLWYASRIYEEECME